MAPRRPVPPCLLCTLCLAHTAPLCAVGAELLIYGAAAPWDTAGDRVGDGGRAALPPDQDLRVRVSSNSAGGG